MNKTMWVWPALGFACGLSVGILGLYIAASGALVSVIASANDNRALTLAAATLGMVAGIVLLAAVSDVSRAADFRFVLWGR